MSTGEYKTSLTFLYFEKVQIDRDFLFSRRKYPKMKINILLPTTEVYGGVRAILEISNVLQRRGHEVEVIVPAIKTLPKDAPLESLRRVLTYGQRRKANSSIDWFDFEGDIRTVPHMLLTRYFPSWCIPDADVTVATWWKSAYYLNEFPPAKGKKFYFIQHFETHGGNPEAVKRTYRLPLNQIVTSTWLKEKIESLSDNVRGQVLYGVDFETFYMESDTYDVEEPIRVGMMYSNREWKGNAEGFDAYKNVAGKNNVEMELVLFGRERGDDVPKYAEFHEDPEQDELRQIYNSLDVFVMPSHHEGFGMPPMEAMACGTACLVTDVGGVPDFTIPGETAEVVPPKNVAALTTSLEKLVADPERIQRLAREGHDHIQQFTWDRCGKAFERLLTEDASERPEK